MRRPWPILPLALVTVALGLAACGEARDPDAGGVGACRDWIENEVEACGGWLGFDDPWCDSLRLEIDDGCDCQNVIDWLRASTACEDGTYGWIDGADSAELPTCACPTGPVNL